MAVSGSDEINILINCQKIGVNKNLKSTNIRNGLGMHLQADPIKICNLENILIIRYSKHSYKKQMINST